MTAPDMESIIAGVLAEHRPNVTLEWCGADGCERNLPWGTVTPLERRDAQIAHQARAVLAAISEAGGIPATSCGHFTDTQGEEFGPSSPCVSALGHTGYHKDSKGLAFGPWTAVEG